jgi:hypothetical protein
MKKIKKELDKPGRLCYTIITKEKEKEIKKMKKFNLWRSIPSGQVYKMEADWMPRFGGWELIGSVWED